MLKIKKKQKMLSVIRNYYFYIRKLFYQLNNIYLDKTFCDSYIHQQFM